MIRWAKLNTQIVVLTNKIFSWLEKFDERRLDVWIGMSMCVDIKCTTAFRGVALPLWRLQNQCSDKCGT